MSRQIRSRRLGLTPEESRFRPIYARVLGLRYLNPGGVLCFVYFEGTLALGVLLALAELVSWWVVLILPGSVAVMVKVNDVVAGAAARSAARTPERERAKLRSEVSAFMPVVGRAAVAAGPMEAARRPVTHPINVHPADDVDHVHALSQRARQSASRRYN